MRGKRWAAAFLSALLVLPVAAACKKETQAPAASYDATASLQSIGSKTVAGNSRYSLMWEDSVKAVFLRDKQTQTIWGTVPYEYYYAGESGADLHLYSTITIDYIEPVNNQIKTVESYAGVMDGRVLASPVEGGIEVTYCFDQQEIAVPVQFLLRENGLEVRIMVSKVIEGRNRLQQVRLAPFFASVKNDTQGGCLFVPSGSGALMTADTSRGQRTFRDDVYGKDPVTNIRDQAKITEPIRLPVFGATDGESAMLGIIEQGAEYAWIQAVAGYEAIGYAGIGSGFRLRGSDIVYVPGLSGTATPTSYFADDLIDIDYLSVGYYPLYGEDAGIVGMAEAYAAYLEGKKALPAKGETPQLMLEFLGGVQCRENFLGFPYRSVQPAATFDQVRAVLQDLCAAAEVSPVVKLTGYGNAGLDVGKVAGGFGFHSAMGGQKGYTALKDYCAAQGLSLFADFDLIHYRQSADGFSVNFQPALKVSGEVAYQYVYSPMFQGYREEMDYHYRLLGRDRLTAAAGKLLNKAGKLGLTGISLESLGSTAYSDYRDETYQVRGGMSGDAAEILESFRKAGHPVMTASPNDYAAVRSDVIAGSPAGSALYDVLDQEVPFYQIVFRGRIPLALSPINMAGNLTDRYLQAVATGTSLYFTLSQSYEDRFAYSTQSALLASLYGDNRDRILSMLEESAAFYKAADGCRIVGYSRLADGVTRTDFDNGVSVVVNRTDSPVQSPLGTVDARSFVYAG